MTDNFDKHLRENPMPTKNVSTNGGNEKYVYMNLLEVEAISIDDDECLYFNEYGSVQRVCEELNELYDENQRLEIENQSLKRTVDRALRLVYDLGCDEMQRQWEEIMEVLDE